MVVYFLIDVYFFIVGSFKAPFQRRNPEESGWKVHPSIYPVAWVIKN